MCSYVIRYLLGSNIRSNYYIYVYDLYILQRLCQKQWWMVETGFWRVVVVESGGILIFMNEGSLVEDNRNIIELLRSQDLVRI